ncbi:MAG: hypothetical protein M3Z04_04095 [Chloroflexota bacterium]|nr:hypothetical protein [Chloroflexota bacterium]
MENETRHLPADAARGPAAGPWPAPADPVGTPTTYLPPVPAPRDARTGTSYEVPPPFYQGPGGYAPPALNNVVGNAMSTPFAPIAGPLLIGLGALALLLLDGAHGTHVFGTMFLLALGQIFLYVSRRRGGMLGFRIPGCILTGLGAGAVLDAATGFDGGGWSAIGLGLGFFSLWLMDRRQWWWLIPSAAIFFGGLDDLTSSSRLSTPGTLLPVALILLGAYIWRERKARVGV